ncbi:MAG: isoleucine--tRNA ligase [Erysipelotrichaceae bacterium]|uniref:Isoleucine--tRNA ligase n=1 Tax=Copranaerobaculum intestinale TaxID=2692629 RepID=A0A6N8U622_9FIRM|nr:isoleucine--tRNA ligase [Copranaerobaculum intestinale]MBS6373231.1 isoleucine--tRNA ligase [Erysipelotrichaceae bacterium]MXQ73512.1 isoleucine--tRNA ligase [Copranaerobaculum intestinale]
MEYKDTLRMPKTAFEMRGKLPTKEPLFQKRWKEADMYHKMLEKRDGAPTFNLHDGPPYANGDIHIGHALNKILKDVIVRSHYMMGYRTPYIPGWDTHGLPIEHAITKLGHDRKQMSVAEFRKLCYNYALEQVEKQKQGFLKLGVVGDYDHPYITLTKEYEADQIKIFAKMAMEGLIYKGRKPVYWSPSSESALAEAEIEYHDIKSPTIFVSFPVVDTKGVLEGDESFIIWTTTPWTIPANLAICLNADFTYAVVQSEKGKFIVLEELVDSLWEKFGLSEKNIVKTYKGKELEGITAQHPFMNRTSLVILGDHVTADAGTGCVHTAPGHGVDDFNVGMKYGLEAFCPVDEKGCMMKEAGAFLEGQYVDDANKTVVKKLDELGVLLKMEWITHSYPHDWRTKKPIIFRATTQWFASIDKIREKVLNEIDNISWVPSWGQTRMHNMIADRGDWCISRQRAWGVPIPILYAEDGTPIMEEAVFEHIAELVREHGTNVWFEREAGELVPNGYTHPGSPNGKFRKETDIMDVWFDSGSSHTGSMVASGEAYPADLYFEGSDQYRGWFNSSLIIGTAYYGSAPYKQVLSHGFIMDGKGMKMSKSQFNAVSPAEVTKKYGADILRLWATSVDYQADCSMSDEILKQCSEMYRKVRNTFRFLLGNIAPEDFTKADLVPVEKLDDLDKYMLIRLNDVNEKTKKAYEEYRFSDITSMLSNLMTNELSAYYLDYAKDVLYIEKQDDPKRRMMQTVLYHACDVLLRAWAPILTHTCEEVNDFFHTEAESIHLGEFAPLFAVENADAIREKVERLLVIRNDVLKALEEARAEKIIGKSLEAHVFLHVSDDDNRLIDEMLGERLAQWLIVSEATLTNVELKPYEVAQIKVEVCNGVVCPRCWNITESTREDGLCDRCAKVLK